MLTTDTESHLPLSPRAARSLVTATAVALLAVVLLYLALDSFLDAAVILVTIPVSFIGGIVAHASGPDGSTWRPDDVTETKLHAAAIASRLTSGKTLARLEVSTEFFAALLNFSLAEGVSMTSARIKETHDTASR